MPQKQYVCLVCGFNMVGFHPQNCPFCAAHRTHFITATECSERFSVVATPVNRQVTRLQSAPPLGLEHAAYRIDTGRGICWIDCPSCFDPTLDPPEAILFTHHHFLGACNLYRRRLGPEIRIHQLDTRHDICGPFTFDAPFEGRFTHHGIEAIPIDGHTPGFTCYLFEDVLFICDYLFLTEDGMKFNPYGPAERTVAGGERLGEILAGRDLATVCGYNYVIDYGEWKRRFDAGPIFGGF